MLFSILVVDDDPNNFDVIETLLDSENYQLHYAADGQEAISSLDTFNPDLILLDVMMPVMDGIAVCQRIKTIPKWEAVPIIMVTALVGNENLAKCLLAGADDFISKPVNRLELNARVRSMLRIHQQHQELAIFNSRLEALVQQRTIQLQNIIFQDALTNLPSRAFLLEVLTKQLTTTNNSFALITLDCDRFTLVNASFGHEMGDRLLVAIAHRLKKRLRPNDLLVRMGEDEFCFFIHRVEDFTDLESIIESILQDFQQSFQVQNFEIFMSVCIGATLQFDSSESPEELLQSADTAMYQAKMRGSGSYQIFEHEMRLAMLNRLTLENDLQRALKQSEFITYYQPIFDLKTQTLTGFEALIRWQHPERQMVPPDEFIPSMEATGLIVPVGMVVFKQACQQLKTWHDRGYSNLIMSVNLSPRQFTCPTLIAEIDGVLRDIQLDPAYLNLEITESAIIENAESAIAITQMLRALQIQISIDDFGTGYSSLGSLHRFPVDRLKIDRSFVNEIRPENSKYHVINAIIALGQQLGLAIVAEGIETQYQLEWLQNLDCEFGQGYFFSRPLPASQIEQIYLNKSS
jgi:diguanylate cyclase (GGDEF)-like protein